MIKLPEKWEESIQLRDWMYPVSELSQIAFLLLCVRSGNNWWGYSKKIEIPYQQIVINNHDNGIEILKEAYETMLYELPAIAAEQKYAILSKRKIVKIKDDDKWEILLIPDLKIAKEVLYA